MGGEETIHALVERFYDHMDSLPEAAGVRAMHASSLKVSREKLFQFLSGWTGGPQLYIERYGHPRLRARHLPFAVDTEARDQWLRCMERALEEVVEDEGLRRRFYGAMAHIANHMRNTPDPA